MSLMRVVYLIHGNILPSSISNFRISDRLVLESVYRKNCEGYGDSSWIEHMKHYKAYVGMESAEKGEHLIQAENI